MNSFIDRIREKYEAASLPPSATFLCLKAYGKHSVHTYYDLEHGMYYVISDGRSMVCVQLFPAEAESMRHAIELA